MPVLTWTFIYFSDGNRSIDHEDLLEANQSVSLREGVRMKAATICPCISSIVKWKQQQLPSFLKQILEFKKKHGKVIPHILGPAL